MKEDVLAAIEGERAYQNLKWPGHHHTTAEWLLIMQKCLTEAQSKWVTGHGDNGALHEIRQVVAVGVAALEQCGAPRRDDSPYIRPEPRPAWWKEEQLRNVLDSVHQYLVDVAPLLESAHKPDGTLDLDAPNSGVGQVLRKIRAAITT